jgi:hypothetical protein
MLSVMPMAASADMEDGRRGGMENETANEAENDEESGACELALDARAEGCRSEKTRR